MLKLTKQKRKRMYLCTKSWGKFQKGEYYHQYEINRVPEEAHVNFKWQEPKVEPPIEFTKEPEVISEVHVPIEPVEEITNNSLVSDNVKIAIENVPSKKTKKSWE